MRRHGFIQQPPANDRSLERDVRNQPSHPKTTHLFIYYVTINRLLIKTETAWVLGAFVCICPSGVLLMKGEQQWNPHTAPITHTTTHTLSRLSVTTGFDLRFDGFYVFVLFKRVRVKKILWRYPASGSNKLYGHTLNIKDLN